MLKLISDQISRTYNETTRRDFLKIGSLSAGGVSLATLLSSRAAALEAGKPTTETSVVWLWLSGGATHVETFDPKMTAPSEFHSITGEVATNLPGVSIGGTFPKIAQLADKMAIVRSFAHKNSGHAGGTHWVMTGYDNRTVDNGGRPNRPSIGSITAKFRGANHPATGMPTYVRMNGIGSDGPAFLGTPYAPFEPQGQASKNLTLNTKLDRVSDRRALLHDLDRFERDADHTGLMEGLDQFESQAFNLILGVAPQAFDLKKEDQNLVRQYGKGLGEQMLIARRLCEAGCGFVTINYGGWDMHGQIKRGMEQRSPMLDHSVSTFINDVSQRGLSEKILLVISGEFGRTPRINKSAGRDHWAPLSTLAFSGGGLKMGQVVGTSSSKAEVPHSNPINPQDVMATVFSVLGIDRKLQVSNQSGRPVFMLEEGEPIRELIGS